MPPKGLPSCGFAVNGTKKGEIPFKLEKRARGKRVTVISNVVGDATKLLRALQSLLGVGGTVRSAGQGVWSVEVQGDQTQRVLQAALDFGCFQGVSSTALDEARSSLQSTKEDIVVVNRTAATKFLAQTNGPAKSDSADERRKLLEMESEFYGQYWQNFATSSMDENILGDVWDGDIWEDPVGDRMSASTSVAQTVAELNISLQVLGMLSEEGRAVREFWASTGLTIEQFRKRALNPGARFITDDVQKRSRPSNLVSRQKLSDWRSGGGGKQAYFSAPISAIDNYEKGLPGRAEAQQDDQASAVEESKMQVTSDSDGWSVASLSYCVPFRTPASRLDDQESDLVAKAALRRIGESLHAELKVVQQKVVGVALRLDLETFGLDLKLNEGDFLFAPKVEVKTGNRPDKDEMRLEKKLREICSLRRRQLDGERLEKLQAEKVATRLEVFEDLAQMKLRRAEADILRVFKRSEQRFRDAFHEEEWKALYEEKPGSSTEATLFGTFDRDRWSSTVKVSTDGLSVESSSSRWVGGLLHLAVQTGEVGAFAIEVLDGLLRVGWAFDGFSFDELGSDTGSFGFGGTGKKVHAGKFDAYGQVFKKGDVIHCEAERDGDVVRIGYAKNNDPLGVAFEVEDRSSDLALLGAICGKDGFQARVISAECVPLEEAPVLEGYIEFSPARSAVAVRNFTAGDSDDALPLWEGETVYVSCDDGRGWLFGYFLDPEDPDDGGWFPADCVRLLDAEDAAGQDGWSAAPSRGDVIAHQAWAAAPSADVAAAVAWGEAPAASGSIDAWTAPPAAVIAPCRPDLKPRDVPAALGHTAGSEASPLAVALEEWLRSLSLLRYSDKAIEWCSQMGAVAMHEVLENWEDFCDTLQLKPLERKRVARAAEAL